MVAMQIHVVGLQSGNVVIALILELGNNRVHWTLRSKNPVAGL